MKHLHFYLLCCCLLAGFGCENRSTNPAAGAVDPEYQRQMKESARLLEVSAKQHEEVQRQIDRAAMQAERLDKLLQRWEQQADRQDKLLDRQERQAQPPEGAR